MRNSESLMDEAKCVLDDTMERLTDNNVTDWGKIKTEVKDALGDFVWKETKKTDDYTYNYGSVGIAYGF